MNLYKYFNRCISTFKLTEKRKLISTIELKQTIGNDSKLYFTYCKIEQHYFEIYQNKVDKKK